MSKITITGAAERNVYYDAIKITVNFTNRADNSSDAINTVLDQCESFLSIMNDMGISIENIHIGQNSTNQGYDKGNVYFIATREITMHINFNMNFINSVMEILSDKKFSANFDSEYILTNSIEIHNELIKEAIADSKAKAQDIVNALGQKVVGIDNIIVNRFYDRASVAKCENAVALCSRRLDFSSKLKAPTTKESESVEVVWIIE